MCGRTYVDLADPEIRAMVEEINRSTLAERFRQEGGILLREAGEVLPSAVVPAAAVSRAGNRRVFPMKWGFSRSAFTGKPGGLLINARAETAAEKATFRESWEKRRCAIPVSGYFEWDHPLGTDGKKRPGQKYALRPEGEGIVWLAGLYRMERELPAFVILTRPAAEEIAWMHDRMPVMLAAEDAAEWIRPEADPERLVGRCLTRVRWEKAG